MRICLSPGYLFNSIHLLRPRRDGNNRRHQTVAVLSHPSLHLLLLPALLLLLMRYNCRHTIFQHLPNGHMCSGDMLRSLLSAKRTQMFCVRSKFASTPHTHSPNISHFAMSLTKIYLKCGVHCFVCRCHIEYNIQLKVTIVFDNENRKETETRKKIRI